MGQHPPKKQDFLAIGSRQETLPPPVGRKAGVGWVVVGWGGWLGGGGLGGLGWMGWAGWVGWVGKLISIMALQPLSRILNIQK